MDASSVAATAEDGGVLHVVSVHPTPSEWQVSPTAEGDLAVEVTLPAAGTQTLAAARLEAHRRSLITSVVEHAAAHWRRAGQPDDGVLRTRTGVPGIDEGVAWLAARVASGAPGPLDSPDDLLWWGLGALAAGRSDTARRAVEALPSGQAHRAFLAGRIALTTGDQRAARECVGFRPTDALGALAARTLADGLRHGASEDELAALRARGDRARDRGGGGALPVVGGPRTDDPIRALAERTLQSTARGDAREAALHTLLELADGSPQGWITWRRLLEEGLQGGPAGRATWDPPDAGAAPAAALLLCGLAHGILGWDPDAPVGRVRLAPVFPGHLTHLAATGLRVGRSVLDLEYAREGHRHAFALRPREGRVPPLVALEPQVSLEGVPRFLVDGDPAELDVQRSSARSRFRVQIPLDAARVVEVFGVDPRQSSS